MGVYFTQYIERAIEILLNLASENELDETLK